MSTSPLHALHERLGARFVDFAGWQMPLQYGGTLAEHQAVRTAVGLFDVSHLGRFSVRGPDTTSALQSLLCNDIAAIEPGEAQYTMLLNVDGGVRDDIIVWRWERDHVWVLPNGANYELVLNAFAEHDGPAPEPKRDDTAMLAVQGPGAPALLDAVFGRHPGRFRVERLEWRGSEVWAAGTGYTGEAGAELVVSAEASIELAEALLDAGAAPCGLGARDTLRLEMGYPLWGQDLDPATTPLEAGLGWVVAWEHDFVGRRALEIQREAGITKQLIGFTFPDRRVARAGAALQCGGGRGLVTSGNFSPTLEVGIGLGYASPPPGDEDRTVEVDVRGRRYVADRQEPPFLEH
jgi:aminomethyltransferase